MATDWFSTDLVVRVKSNHEDPGMIGQTGTITGISVSNFLF